MDWTGIFQIKIGGVTGASFGQEDTDTVNRSPVCFCADRPPPLNVVPGIPVSFWEPVYIIKVVRAPYCSPFPEIVFCLCARAPEPTAARMAPAIAKPFYPSIRIRSGVAVFRI